MTSIQFPDTPLIERVVNIGEFIRILPINSQSSQRKYIRGTLQSIAPVTYIASNISDIYGVTIRLGSNSQILFNPPEFKLNPKASVNFTATPNPTVVDSLGDGDHQLTISADCNVFIVNPVVIVEPSLPEGFVPEIPGSTEVIIKPIGSVPEESAPVGFIPEIPGSTEVIIKPIGTVPENGPPPRPRRLDPDSPGNPDPEDPTPVLSRWRNGITRETLDGKPPYGWFPGDDGFWYPDASLGFKAAPAPIDETSGYDEFGRIIRNRINPRPEII